MNDPVEHFHLEALGIARADLLGPEDDILQVDRSGLDDGFCGHRDFLPSGQYPTRDDPASSGLKPEAL